MNFNAHKIDYVSIGQSIRKYRKQKKLTLLQLAEMIDVSDSFIGQIERGRNKPSLETVVNIANALEVSVDDLLYYNLEAQISLMGSFCTGKCNRDGVTIQVGDTVHTGVTPANFKEFFESNVLSEFTNERI